MFTKQWVIIFCTIILLLGLSLMEKSEAVAQTNLHIVAPSQYVPRYAGSYSNPGKFVIKLNKPTNGLSKKDVTVKIGNNTAMITTFYAGFLNYYIEVLAPSQTDNGQYDLTVTAGQFTDTVIEAVNYADLQNVDVVTVIDRSGSMGVVDMETAKSAAQQFVDVMQEGDKIGVVSFADNATTNFPLTTISADTNSSYTIFNDDMESGTSNWVADAPWALLQTSQSHSPVHAWTDSPGDFYDNYMNVSLTSVSMNLETVAHPVLKFWTRYNIEAGYDFGFVEVSIDDGTTWESLAVYTGYQDAWTEKSVYLSSVAGESSVQIRFRLETDDIVVEDGWYIDDVEVVNSGDSTRDLAKFAIDGITSGGQTAMGFGLLLGQIHLKNNGVPLNSDAMILLSDGYENKWPYVHSVLSSVKKEKTVVHTIGLGNSADISLLSWVAAQTGGTSYYAPSSDELADIYCTIAGTISGQQPFICQTGSINTGQLFDTTVQSLPFYSGLTIRLSWKEASAQLYLTLEDPNGRIINPTVAASDPMIKYKSRPKYQRYQIDNPVPGIWKVRVERAADTTLTTNSVTVDEEPFTLTILGKSNLTLNIHSSKDTYKPGENIEIAATLADEQPILNAQVEATLQLPTSTQANSFYSELERSDRKGDKSPIPVDINFVSNSVTLQTLTLTDDDNDGVYIGAIPGDQVTEGVYIFNVTASGNSNQNPSVSFVHEAQRVINVTEPSQIYLPLIIK